MPVLGTQLPLERVIEIAEFRAALRAFTRRSEAVCRDWDLTPQRYLLLLAIEGSPDGSRRMSFTEIARRLQLSRNTVTELCGRAEESGLLVREPSKEDQRVIYLRLTAEAERRLYGVLRESDEDRRALMEVFALGEETLITATSSIAAPE